MLKYVYSWILCVVMMNLSFGGWASTTDMTFHRTYKITKEAKQADSDSSITLGYCVDAEGGYAGVQNTQETECGACVKFPKEMLAPYVGSKITKIDFAVHDHTPMRIVAYVTTSLGGRPISSKKLSSYEVGWNEATLPTPYTITGDTDLYVGYTIYTTSEPCFAISFDNVGPAVKGVNFGVSSMGAAWAPLDLAGSNLRIRAMVEGDNLPTNCVSISDIDTYDIISKPMDGLAFRVKNLGVDVVKSIEASCKINGVSKGTLTVDTLNILNTKESLLKIENVAFDKSGNNTLEVTVNKVNGKDNTYNSTKTKDVYFTNSVAPSERTSLVEEFSIETDDMNVIADIEYDAATKLENVAWVNHHVAYDVDQFTVNESKDYLRFYDSDEYYVPGLMVDRTYISGFEDTFGPVFFAGSLGLVKQVIGVCQSMPSFVSMSINDNVINNNTLSFKVNANSGVGEMPFQTDLRLNVFLVENNVASTSQAGYSGTYYHNHVLRRVLTQSSGDPIDLTSHEVARQFTTTIPEGWNKDNLGIVAFISNYDAFNVNSNMVYNAAQYNNSTSGVATVDMSSKGKIRNSSEAVWVENVECNTMKLFDMTGREVANVLGGYMETTTLQKGVYIVKALCADGNVLSQKIVVSK